MSLQVLLPILLPSVAACKGIHYSSWITKAIIFTKEAWIEVAKGIFHNVDAHLVIDIDKKNLLVKTILQFKLKSLRARLTFCHLGHGQCTRGTIRGPSSKVLAYLIIIRCIYLRLQQVHLSSTFKLAFVHMRVLKGRMSQKTLPRKKSFLQHEQLLKFLLWSIVDRIACCTIISTQGDSSHMFLTLHSRWCLQSLVMFTWCV